LPRHRGFDQQDGDHLPSGVISPFGSGISQLVMLDDTGGYLRNFFQGQDSANSKAMNIILGPFLDVAGYSFAAASVLAPLSGFNIVTEFFKQMGNRNHTHGELPIQKSSCCDHEITSTIVLSQTNVLFFSIENGSALALLIFVVVFVFS